MCTVSMVGDFYNDKWRQHFPPNTIGQPFVPLIPNQEIERLRREVEDMKELLKRAKIYDEKNGEPNCELEEKMKIIRAMAKALGVELPA